MFVAGGGRVGAVAGAVGGVGAGGRGGAISVAFGSVEGFTGVVIGIGAGGSVGAVAVANVEGFTDAVRGRVGALTGGAGGHVGAGETTTV